MAPRTVILLPPSEGKAEGGTGAAWSPGRSALPELDDLRLEVLAHLAHLAEERGTDVSFAPTMPAIERYAGVLYKELDQSSITGTARRRLDRQVLIVSGLWGLAAPRDPIPWYKLKMSARLEPLGRLSRWWRPGLSEALEPRVRRARVWDLLPNEHSDAIDWSVLAPRQRVTVRFVTAEGKTVSHWNKLLKGSLVRWLVESGAGPEDLGGFDHPQGYRLDRRASTFAESEVAVVMRQRS